MIRERARRHDLVPHTADIGFRAAARDLPSLFEEAIAALAEVGAEVEPGASPTTWHEVDLRAPDLAGLAYAWLNEAVSLAEIDRAAIVTAVVDRVARGHSDGRAWDLGGRLGTRAWSESGVRPRRSVKSATFHRLSVERVPGGWAMQAFLDV